jgi:sarcosine oxidase subunit delta
VREFTYLGDAAPERPDPNVVGAIDRFIPYVYLRDNPAGAHRELWYHGAGCQAWLAVERDTRTHAITAVHSYKAGA